MFSTPTPPEPSSRSSVRTPSSASNQYKKRWSKGTPASSENTTPGSLKEDRLTPHQLTPAEVDVVHQSLMRGAFRSPSASAAQTASNAAATEDADAMDMDMDIDCDTSFLSEDTAAAPSSSTIATASATPESPTKLEFERALSEETLGASAESARKSLKTKNRVPTNTNANINLNNNNTFNLNVNNNFSESSCSSSYVAATQTLYSGGSAPAPKAVCEDSRARGFFACSESALRGSGSGGGGGGPGARGIWGDGGDGSSGAGASRYVSRTPERILDAPELKDDYYINVLDWSVRDNVLAVALGNSVYLWNADTGVTHTLSPTRLATTSSSSLSSSSSGGGGGGSEAEYVSSVRWVRGSNGSMGSSQYLAIGTSGGTVQLWDCQQLAPLRSMGGHAGRVGSLSWMDHMVASGSRDSTVVIHDVRRQQHRCATLCAHRLEVCGLEWSPSGQQLASGGNDNALCVWDSDAVAYGAPRFAFAQHHRAAVKAVAWCPWQQNLLASGGGTADGCIRLWNTAGGSCLRCVETGAQVTALLWSLTYRELVSGHGYSRNQLVVWKFPSMERVAELIGHERRVLHMARSPDSSVVVSAGADETLRFWKIWPVPWGLCKNKGGGGAAAADREMGSGGGVINNNGGGDSGFYSMNYKR